ncbi:MAG TPA: histidine phosphatase family protein, partial [Vicinamibacterales bacterium]|nr:histidine phosphatase family protein [Vicinamibacterales bacterium]
HAAAVDSATDPQRPLSAAGRAHAERVAAEAAARGIKPAVIWHSGKLRARQTADPFLRACNPFAELTAVRGLQPTDPPESIRDVLEAESRDIMLVGHMPHLPRLYALLVGEAGEGADFPPHGLVALQQVEGEPPERGPWRVTEKLR